MCGNTIGQDRRFMARWLPNLEEYFHYRYLDVSTLKELTRRWAPEKTRNIQKATKHQALSDHRGKHRGASVLPPRDPEDLTDGPHLN